jgi:hypothetical protein
MQAYIHTYIRIYIHTDIHTYIHTYRLLAIQETTGDRISEHLGEFAHVRIILLRQRTLIHGCLIQVRTTQVSKET